MNNRLNQNHINAAISAVHDRAEQAKRERIERARLAHALAVGDITTVGVSMSKITLDGLKK